jgi:aspartyl-tRNA(Asn)/glutamyl-tRNA(Gln) amidotransferase subunit A
MTCPVSTEKLTALNEKYRPFAEIAQDLKEMSEYPPKFHFSAKDNICAIGFQARAGSKILEGYRPPFDATAVQKMREANGILIGKTNMDEFGFGTFCTNSAFGIPLNPHDTERTCGGSSGGSAAITALLDKHVALAESTGGSISCPASFCGVVGFTPTYGRVSRYGLIDYANSLDKIGLVTRSASDLRRFLPIISGPDKRDPTSCVQPLLRLDGPPVKRIAVPEEALQNLDPAVLRSFESALDKLNGMGIEVRRVSMPSLGYALAAYYVLATSEASTNLARYKGMLFGVRGGQIDQSFNDYFSEVRSANFGKEAKRRVLLGTYTRMVGFRDRYYLKALAVRQLIIKEYQGLMEKDDLIITPTMPFIAPRFTEIAKMKPLEVYQADFLTVPPNLTGMPHISLPCGYHDSMPIGMQLVAPHWEEGRLLNVAERWCNDFKIRFPEVSG